MNNEGIINAINEAAETIGMSCAPDNTNIERELEEMKIGNFQSNELIADAIDRQTRELSEIITTLTEELGEIREAITHK